MDLLALIRRLPELIAYNKFDDDFFDRLNSSHTVAILSVFAIILTNRQFSDKQIKCWVPAQFSVSYEEYVNRICFITNTYSSENSEMSRRPEDELKYYQWTPFILVLMSIVFYVPHQFWRGLSLRSGVDLEDLIEAGQTYRSANIRHEEKVKVLDYLTNWLNDYCSNPYRLSTRTKRHFQRSKPKLIRLGNDLFFPSDIYTGYYLVNSYLFVKFLYLFNSIGQILFLNVVLGKEFDFFGIQFIHRYWNKQIGILQTANEYFPKLVFCDFTVREANHPRESHRYTVQCVLPFNLFNQQIFTYLYFWLVILSSLNIASLIIWFYRLSPSNNFRYLERRLTFHSLNNEEELRQIFVKQYLQGDGAFMLRLLTSNVNDYVCTKIVLELYSKFCTSIRTDTIHQLSPFQPISKTKSDDNIDNDEGSSDQTDAADAPPIPNPRQGKMFNDNQTSQESTSDISTNEHPTESHRTVSFSIPLSSQQTSIRLRTSPKETHLSSINKTESKDQRILEQNIETLPDSDSSPSALSLFPLSSTSKGPSPYATTYLMTKKRSEHEMPDIDDSLSSGSTSTRSNNILLVRQSNKQINNIQSENLLSRRIHDV